MPDDAIDLGVDALLHDSSIRLRRWCAGVLMWGQGGRRMIVAAAFRQILEADDDRVLRHRAATYVASDEQPRGSLPHREWIGPWQRRIAELASAS